MSRRRFKQSLSLGDRLAEEAARLREQAARLPPGIERDELLRRAQQTDTAAHVNEWLFIAGFTAAKMSPVWPPGT
jgi:hypothetical protein